MKQKQKSISAIQNERMRITEALFNATREGHLKQTHILHKQLSKVEAELNNRSTMEDK